MSLITYEEYKEKFERLLSDTDISEVEFNVLIKELVFQTPQNAEQRKIPFTNYLAAELTRYQNNPSCCS